jgi:hypothetical protein
MTPAIVFLTGLVLTLGVVFLTLLYLRHPLFVILSDLCGTVERAEFWTAFSNITLFLIPFVLALNHKPTAGGNQFTVFAISDQIESAIVGLIISVVILGMILSWHISRSRVPLAPKEAGAKQGAI